MVKATRGFWWSLLVLSPISSHNPTTCSQSNWSYKEAQKRSHMRFSKETRPSGGKPHSCETETKYKDSGLLLFILFDLLMVTVQNVTGIKDGMIMKGWMNLVAEDFDLAVGAVQRFVTAVVVAVSIDLDHQWESLHPLLRGEVCTQTVHRDEDLNTTQTSSVPKHSSSACRSSDWTVGVTVPINPAQVSETG